MPGIPQETINVRASDILSDEYDDANKTSGSMSRFFLINHQLDEATFHINRLYFMLLSSTLFDTV